MRVPNRLQGNDYKEKCNRVDGQVQQLEEGQENVVGPNYLLVEYKPW